MSSSSIGGKAGFEGLLAVLKDLSICLLISSGSIDVGVVLTVPSPDVPNSFTEVVDEAADRLDNDREYGGRGTESVEAGDDLIGEEAKSEVEEGERCRPKKKPFIASEAIARGLLADRARFVPGSTSDIGIGSAIDSISDCARSSFAKSIRVGSELRGADSTEAREGGLFSSKLSFAEVLECENGLTACKTEAVSVLEAEDTELLRRIRGVGTGA